MPGRSAEAVRISLVDRALFVRKTVSVFVLAFALIPLLALRTDVPALAYGGALVVLHVFVLGIYFYRVRVRELDPDWRSLAARVLALGAVTYLLYAASDLEAGAPLARLFPQITGLWVLHTVILLLLMLRIEYAPRPALTEAAPGGEAAPES